MSQCTLRRVPGPRLKTCCNRNGAWQRWKVLAEANVGTVEETVGDCSSGAALLRRPSRARRCCSYGMADI